ncbi:P-loop containing nucleoside triphosphate hydrolase protein [Fomes fomentarius]|nr:P-loop containing nucleoside triphosphate hydrolase protein [Fomes fomentarius]
MEAIMNLVCKELDRPPALLRDVAHLGEERFTSGESALDDILGGGIYTGMLWEISGENNAGKTQLALQLSLTVQLPTKFGGLFGAACYITNREELQTERLKQMIDCHPILSPQFCGLPDIYTVRAPNFAAFLRVLTETVTQFAEERASSPHLKPAKLVVVDTFSDYFDADKNPDYADLYLRARHLRQSSLLLMQLATKHRLAVVLLCSTRETRPRIDGHDRSAGELRYSDQARWFSRAHTVVGEDAHEGTLGHIWPNQLNARLMMSRTNRTRLRSEVDPTYDEGRGAKRRKLDSSAVHSSQPDGDGRIAFRRLSVIFSSVATPASCDYVILEQGVVALVPEDPLPSTFLYATSTPGGVSPRSRHSLSNVIGPPLPLPTPPPQAAASAMEDDEDEMFWELTQDQAELFDALPDQALRSEEEAAEEGPPQDLI